MRIIGLVLLFCSVASAQTPFEFAVVRQLIEGDPFVSVMRIDLVSGSPAPGCNTVELSARAGLSISGEGHSVYADTVCDGRVTFAGQSLFRMDIYSSQFDRILQVLLEQSRAFPSTRVTHARLDVVSPDDMSWISITFPLTLADSLRSGLVAREAFWSLAEVTSLEVGTALFPLAFRPPLDFSMPESGTPVDVAVETRGSGGHAWKSLVLPGWGQIASGSGVGWLNLLVEACGIGLYASGYEEEGLAVVGVNHIVSFMDLL